MAKRGSALLLCVLVLAAGAYPADPPVSSAPATVRFQRMYPPGSYTMTQTLNMDQAISGRGMEQQHKLSQTIVHSLVASKPDAAGERTLEMRIRRIKQEVKAGPQTMVYDSDLPPEKQTSPMAGLLGPLLKVKIVAVVGPDGTVRKVSGADEMWEEMAKNNPAVAMMAEAMKKNFGNATVQSLMLQAYEMMPGRPVGLGENWTSRMELPIPMVGGMKVEQKLWLKAIEDTPSGKVAVLEKVGTIKTDKPTQTTIGPATVTFRSVEVAQKGQLRYNEKLGIFTAQEDEVRGTLAMAMTGPNGAEQVVTMKMEGTTKVTTEPQPPVQESPATQPR